MFKHLKRLWIIKELENKIIIQVTVQFEQKLFSKCSWSAGNIHSRIMNYSKSLSLSRSVRYIIFNPHHCVFEQIDFHCKFRRSLALAFGNENTPRRSTKVIHQPLEPGLLAAIACILRVTKRASALWCWCNFTSYARNLSSLNGKTLLEIPRRKKK